MKQIKNNLMLITVFFTVSVFGRNANEWNNMFFTEQNDIGEFGLPSDDFFNAKLSGNAPPALYTGFEGFRTFSSGGIGGEDPPPDPTVPNPVPIGDAMPFAVMLSIIYGFIRYRKKSQKGEKA